ncbi:capsid cement protein [Prescottella equi]
MNRSNRRAHTTTDLEVARFVDVAGPRTIGNIAVRHAAAGSRVLGVTGRTAKAGELTHVLRGSRIVGVATAGTIAAGAPVAAAAAADGKATTATEDAITVGQAVDTSSEGIVYVALA